MNRAPPTCQLQSTTIDSHRSPIVRWSIPEYPLVRPRHSHSILSTHRNALIYKRKFFLRTLEHRAPDPSEIFALEFKGTIGRFEICLVSATIGIDRSIFLKSIELQRARVTWKNTVSLCDNKFEGVPT